MTEPLTFTTFEHLVAALKARRIHLGMSQLAVDQAAGLPDGYTSKLEMSLTNPSAKNARSLGRESLPLLLGALGMGFAVVASNRRASKSEKEISALQANLLSSFLTERSRKGQEARNLKLSPQRRRAIARKAAVARWNKQASKEQSK